MPVNCGVCGLDCAGDNESIKCVGLCQGVFHVDCVAGGNQEFLKTRGAKKEWQCEQCKLVKTSSVASSKTAAATPMTNEFFMKTLEAFKCEVFDELRRYGKEFAEFRASMDFFSEKMDKNNELMAELKQECNNIKKENEEIKAENRALKKSVTALEQRMRNMEQYSRQSNIEINGVPESNGERLEDLLVDIARSIKVEMKKERIIAAHRVPTYSRNRTQPIIVKFSSKQDRDAWLHAFKEVRPLTADKINKHFSKDKVYVNEHLSPETKQLLGKAKETARAKGFKYVWSRDGRIFVRRDNGEKCVRIDGFADLEKL